MDSENTAMPQHSHTGHKNDLDIARTLMLQAQFEELCRITKGLCNIVPLKGISLIQTIYNKDFDRSVGDIDILVFPENKLQEFIQRLQSHGYIPQFRYLQSASAKEIKRKVAMISPQKCLYSDVDIHTAFVSKKFYSQYAKIFNEDALLRCYKTKENVYFMDDVDQWLYLAQHACFHLFTEKKWLRDLYLLWNGFSESDKDTLKKRIEQYDFRRVITATFHFLLKTYPDFKPEIYITEETDKRFCRFISKISESVRFKHTMVVKYFYEFMFIDKKHNRKSAFIRLIFPSLSLMMTIYRSRNQFLLLLLYPLHSIGVFLLLQYFLFITATTKPIGK